MKIARPSPAPEPSPTGVGNTLLRYWWIVLFSAAVSVAATAWFASKQPATYRASATLVLAPTDTLTTTRDVVDALNTLDRRSVVASLAMVPSSRTVKERARADLRLTKAQLRHYNVQTAVVPDTNVIEVTVEGPNPKIDADFAYTLALQSISSVSNYYDIYALKVLDLPSVPTEPVGPGLIRKLLVGGLLGLLIGIGAALLLSHASDRAMGPRLGAQVRRFLDAVGLRRAGQRRPPRVIRGVHLIEASDAAEEAPEDVLRMPTFKQGMASQENEAGQ